MKKKNEEDKLTVGKNDQSIKKKLCFVSVFVCVFLLCIDDDPAPPPTPDTRIFPRFPFLPFPKITTPNQTCLSVIWTLLTRWDPSHTCARTDDVSLYRCIIPLQKKTKKEIVLVSKQSVDPGK